MRTIRYSILLALGASVLASIAMMTVSLAAAPSPNNAAFEVRLEDSGGLSAPVLTGDTANEPLGIDHCEGASIPPKIRESFYIGFRNCLDDVTLPGKDGVPGGGDDLEIDRGEFIAYRDKNTGHMVGITLYFWDTNDKQYTTGFVSVSPAEPVSLTMAFTVVVDADAVDVMAFQGGKKTVVGQVSIGQIVFTPK